MITDLTKFAIKDPLVRERLDRFASDERFRIENLLKIRDVRSRKHIPFRFNEAQLALYKKYRWFRDRRMPVRIIICKSRRAGLSTGVGSLIYDDTTTTPNTQSLIVANESNPSENVLEMSRLFWQYTPETMDVEGKVLKLRPDLPAEFRNNPPKDKLFFAPPLSSKIFLASSKSLNAYLSFLFDNIHATEASRYADGHELFRALGPTLPLEPHTALYVESTPNGQEGRGRWFFEQCMDADARKKTQYGESALVFVPWQHMRLSFSIPFGSPEKRHAFEQTLNDSETDILRRLPFVSLEQMNWRRMILNGPTCTGNEEIFDQEYPCLVYGTLVGTNAGIVPIEEVLVGAVTTSGTVQATRATGTHECVRVRTHMGYTIDCTLTHPLALEGGGFEAAGNVLGRRVRLQAPAFAEKTYVESYSPIPAVECKVVVSPYLARFLGYYMGDGSLYGSTVEFACDARDEDVVANIRLITETYFGSTIQETKRGCTRIRHNSKWTRDVLLALKCAEMRDQLARRVVRVPPCIFRSPKEVVREFLRGLFEADGSATNNTVRFFTKHEEFSKHVQLLLLGFGIHCIRRRVVKKGTEHVGYEIALWSNDAAQFVKEIGFISERKTEPRRPASSRGRRARVTEMVDTVESIEPLGPLPVYDIDVAETHVFDANGMLVHNTDLATAFLMSGHSVFSRKSIKKLMHEGDGATYHVRPPIWEGDIYWGESDESNRHRAAHEVVREPIYLKRHEALAQGRAPHTNEGTFRNLKVWRFARKGERVFLTADVGWGKPETKDGDYSTILVSVLNELQRDEIIMTWRGHVNPMHFGEICAALAWAVRGQVGERATAPVLAPEWNGPGTTTCTYIDKKNLYPRIYLYQPPGVHGMPQSKHIGWESNAKTVRMAVGYMLYMVERDLIDIPDERIATEMSNYREKDDMGDEGSYGGAAGRHDDFVAALRITCALHRLGSKTIPGDSEATQIDEGAHDDDGDLPPWDPFDQPIPGMPGVRPYDVDEDSIEEALFWAS